MARIGQCARSAARLRPWTRAHADVLRVAGVVIAVVTALWLSSWAGPFVVAPVLAAYEGTVTLLARGGTPAPADEEPPEELSPSPGHR
ncbi:hypothetical protein [Streptomyces poonensis]|uniref:Uncharacterized protein n=1 Tax=Streptomyces poonensis TaxID=68255 RepID=A0A918QGQ4_9ACTN|nr:hypothetical protein [Streptomyces poonensis]GGZ43443.1 hypothetical protein GCM10010365_75010 [Streptomyces poonensis]GLJ91714.1 hypothetical protein GCM10017589_43210 [Streptomyces poonensis]